MSSMVNKELIPLFILLLPCQAISHRLLLPLSRLRFLLLECYAAPLDRINFLLGRSHGKDIKQTFHSPYNAPWSEDTVQETTTSLCNDHRKLFITIPPTTNYYQQFQKDRSEAAPTRENN